MRLVPTQWRGRAAKAMLAYEVGTQAYRFFKIAREYVNAKQNYTITISSRDGAFFDMVQEWVYENTEQPKVKAVTLFPSSDTGFRSITTPDENSYAYADHQIRVASSDDTWQPLKFGNNQIKVKVEEEITKPGPGVTVYGGLNIIFHARTKAAQDNLIAELSKLYSSVSSEDKTPQVFVKSGTYGWRRSKMYSSRPLDTIILKSGQLERIVEDIERFIADKDDYARLGVPYHRGYLFYGPPGTGKTSLARALASHFSMPVYYLSLGDMSNDSSLIELISDISKGGILLLEDVDVFGAVNERDAAKGELSMSGLLNVLDGAMTPSGMITIMTTNHADKLDPAVTRPGRIDVKEHLNEFDVDQVNRYFEMFYGRAPKADLAMSAGFAPAVVAEVFKRNLHNAEEAEAMLSYGCTYE